MNFPTLRAVLQSDLPCLQRMIMTILLNHADATGRAWPSQERIATQAGLGERAVRDHLHALVALGWLSIIGHIGRNNIYLVSQPPASAGSVRQELPDDRHDLPESPDDNQHAVPVKPASHATQPARHAAETGAACRLTTQEPLNNYSRTTHMETATPSQGGEVEHSKNKRSSKAETQPPKPKLKAQPAKADWREWNRRQAEEANTVTSAPHMPPDFHAAWQGWQAYRTRRATEARIASEAIPWTRDAAQAALRECERAANLHGWPAVIARIDQAISGNWQGLNTDKIIPARSQPSAPASRRSDTANRPGRYATPPPTLESIMSRAQHLPIPLPAPPALTPTAPPTADAAAEDEAVSGSAYFLNQLNGRSNPSEKSSCSLSTNSDGVKRSHGSIPTTSSASASRNMPLK